MATPTQVALVPSRPCIADRLISCGRSCGDLHTSWASGIAKRQRPSHGSPYLYLPEKNSNCNSAYLICRFQASPLHCHCAGKHNLSPISGLRYVRIELLCHFREALTALNHMGLVKFWQANSVPSHAGWVDALIKIIQAWPLIEMLLYFKLHNIRQIVLV